MFYSCWEMRWCHGKVIHGGDYYMEIIEPDLFAKGSVRIFKHAHPDSLSRDHLIKQGEYSQLEEMQWDFARWTDPIETAYGDF